MNEDPELQRDDDPPKDRSYFQKRGTRMDGNNRLPVLVGLMLVLFFIAGIIYFVSKSPKASDTKGEQALASRMAAIEQKVTDLETQVTELQGKSNKGGTDPFLLHQLEALTKRVEALEKRGQQPGVESKTRPTPTKPTAASQMKYHTVQRGETLLKIGKKYGITVEELRKLNNLSKGQSIKVGQKLLVSVNR